MAFAGTIDGLRLGKIHGWAMYRADLGARVQVDALDCRSKTIARELADRYRADVQRAGFGDGHYGFALPYDRIEQIQKVRISWEKARVEWPVLHSPPRTRHARTFETAGHVLHFDCLPAVGSLTGWALDRRAPGERRLLRLRSGQHLIAEQRATLFRRDCIDEGLDGFHGFSMPLASRVGGLFVEDVASGRKFRVA